MCLCVKLMSGKTKMAAVGYPLDNPGKGETHLRTVSIRLACGRVPGAAPGLSVDGGAISQ